MESNKITGFGNEGANQIPNVGIESPFTNGDFKTEKELIEYIKRRGQETTFVFFIGTPDSGKTAIISSLIYHMGDRTDGNYRAMNFGGDNQQSIDVQEKIRDIIRDRRFPDRTNVGDLNNIDVFFKPSSNHPEMRVTFIDMSGERQKSLLDKTAQGQDKYAVEAFFKAEVSMMFVLVTAHDSKKHLAKDKTTRVDDDIWLEKFIVYLENRGYDTSKLLLLVSQWDTYTGTYIPTQFVAENLPTTCSKLTSIAKTKNTTNNFSSYSVGAVDQEVDNQPYIKKIDDEHPRMILTWIYENATGVKLNKVSLWQKILNLFK
jgi:hypothetical protein